MGLNKIFGWLLLIIGLILIFCTLYLSYNIFTGQREAPEIFKIEPETKVAETGLTLGDNLEEEIKRMLVEQLENIIPIQFFSQFLNLITWTFLAGILIFGGAKISSIGIRLLSLNRCETKTS